MELVSSGVVVFQDVIGGLENYKMIVGLDFFYFFFQTGY